MKRELIRSYCIKDDQNNSAPLSFAPYDMEYGEGKRKSQIGAGNWIGNDKKPVET